MPVRFVSRSGSDHPITKIDYELVTETVKVGSSSLTLTTFGHVEREIDRVFQWLEAAGRPADEIESLAPYFGAIWPAALALAGFLEQPEWAAKLPGKSVLEIGCGLAVPGIIAAKHGASVVVSDNHPDVPRFLERNVALNEPVSLDFSDGDAVTNVDKRYDMVIASDVLYEARLVQVFAEKMSRLVTPEGVCLMADPGRPYIQQFEHAMLAKGWSCELQPWSVRHNGCDADIYLMVFKRA